MSRPNTSFSLVTSGLRELYQRPAGQLPGLDALRSAAILLVICTHWAASFYPLSGGEPTPLQSFPLFSYGWTGVDLFFVLSGFLIGKQLWRELDTTGTVDVGRFLLRRGLRIWPLYVAMLLYYSVVNPEINPNLADWTFLSNYWPGGVSRGWSLSTEEQFYIAVPLLLLLFRKRLGLGGYLWILLALEALVLVVRKIQLDAFFATGGEYAKAEYQLIYPFHTHIEGLLAGLLISLLVVISPRLLEARLPGGLSMRGLVVMIACVAAGLALRQWNQRLFSFVVLGLIFGGVTFWVLADRSVLTRPLNAWVFYPISRLSYGMYLNHGWALPETNDWAVALGRSMTDNREAAFLIGLLVVTLVSIAFAVVTFVLVEHPFLVLRDRWMTRTRRSSVEAAATRAEGQVSAG